MGFLSKMGAAVGVGAAGVTVTLPESEYHWNETIRGTITLTGGNVDQTASEIRVSVMEHWETRDNEGDRDHHYQHHNERVIAANVALKAGSSQELSFEVVVPENESFAHDWYVHARVSVPRAADRHGNQGFRILPPAPLMRVASALTEVSPFNLKFFVNGKDGVHFDFAPPESLKKELDGVRLILREDGAQVNGVFEINPQERSMADRLKALVKKDRVRHDLSFPIETVAGDLNGPAPSEIVARFREWLQPYMS